MQAVNNYIIIDKIKEKPKSKSGFVMTELQNTDIRYLKGKVISVGDLVVVIKEGDVVWYDKNVGNAIEFDDKLFHVIRNGDVVIIE
jgi:co-chaperonin GroES (HSP10)